VGTEIAEFRALDNRRVGHRFREQTAHDLAPGTLAVSPVEGECIQCFDAGCRYAQRDELAPLLKRSLVLGLLRIAGSTQRTETTPDPDQQYPPAARRVLGVLAGSTSPMTVRQIGDDLAGGGHPLKPRTIQDALRKLSDAGEVDEFEADPGKPSLWEKSRL